MKRVALFVSLSTVLLYNCTAKKEEREEIKQFPITNPIVIDTTFTKEYITQIQSLKNIEIRAQEKGFLENIYVDEGQFVQKGQLMFRIMPKLYEAEYLKTKAEVEEASIELQNTKNLAEHDVISKNEQAVAKARLDKAKAEMKLAATHLSFTEIRAPYSGIIDRIPMKLGSLIDEGMLLTTLSDNTKMYAYFNVSEPEYLDYQSNESLKNKSNLTLIMANNKPLPDKGFIQNIEGEFNNETGNIAFRAIFPNSNKLLRNGETGKIQMTIPLQHALIIPQKATYEIQDKKYVFLVDKDGHVKSKNISIDYEMPDLYVVNSSLNEKDRILLEGIQKVKDDQKIAYSYTNPKKVIAALKLKSN